MADGSSQKLLLRKAGFRNCLLFGRLSLGEGRRDLVFKLQWKLLIDLPALNQRGPGVDGSVPFESND